MFEVYGAAIDLDFKPKTPLTLSGRPADIVVRAGPDERSRFADLEPILKGPTDRLYLVEEEYVLCSGESAIFVIGTDEIRYHLYDSSYKNWLEIWLLGTVLSFWLEWQQRLALHASAAVINGHAVGFMATNKGGKSSLAASLMLQGHPLLSDDILVLSGGTPPRAHSSFPQLRMWPEQAAHFVEDVDALQTVHPYTEKKLVPVGRGGIRGSFCSESRPLAALYIPDRRDEAEEISVEPLSQSEALLSIVKESFVVTMIAAAGWQKRRLRQLADIVKAVPVRRLIYPNGIEHLPAVAEAIKEDVTG